MYYCRSSSHLLYLAFSIFALNCVECGHGLSPDFMDWMENNLQLDEMTRIVRNDVTTGSFGGGKYSGNVRPVVMVHGMNNEAGSFWKIRAELAAGGIPGERSFATTWGEGEKGFNLDVKMACKHVIQIRRFIEIVLEYTQSDKINVIGYSMGSPIARKAILGGKCVDNPNVDLGPPLTSKVHIYISVAGANQGSQLCAFPMFDICNYSTGLLCGSQFLRDINSHKKYESTFRSYTITSTADELVGYFACLTKASGFEGAQEYTLNGRSHIATEFDTAHIQLKMLRAGI